MCQLHGNELPLCHLLTQLDRKTSGPRQYAGPVGKLLCKRNFENLLIINFESISADVIDIDEELSSDLSSDQK